MFYNILPIQEILECLISSSGVQKVEMQYLVPTAAQQEAHLVVTMEICAFPST